MRFVSVRDTNITNELDQRVTVLEIIFGIERQDILGEQKDI